MKKNFVKEINDFLKAREEGRDGMEVLETLSPDEIDDLFLLLNKRHCVRGSGSGIRWTRNLDLSKYSGVIGIRDKNGIPIKNGDILYYLNKNFNSEYAYVCFEEYRGISDTEENGSGFGIFFHVSDKTTEVAIPISIMTLNNNKTDEYVVVGNITDSNDVNKFFTDVCFTPNLYVAYE